MAQRGGAVDEAVAIPEWLVLGAYPIRQREHGRWLENGYEAEARFAPTAGEEFRGRTWRPLKATGSGMIDFHYPGTGLEGLMWSYVYVACYVHSPTPQSIRLLLGSDDGYVAYVNGKEVGRIDTNRIMVPDEDECPARLHEGWNLVLLKITQATGAWAFQCRIGGRRTAKLEAPLRFSVRRPRGAGFPGLVDRALGPVVESASLRPSLRRGALGLLADVEVFNDHARAEKNLEVAIGEPDRDPVAIGHLDRIGPFAVDGCALWLPLNRIRENLADPAGRPLAVVVGANGAASTMPVPVGAAAEAFVGILGGVEVPVKGAGRRVIAVPMPRSFRGLPVLVRVEPREPGRLSREISHPELPEVEYRGVDTDVATLRAEVDVPVGAGDIVARIWFGDPEQRLVAERLRFLVREVGAAGDGAIAGEGLAALAEGDLAAATDAAGRMIEAIEKGLGDRRKQSVTLVGHAHLDMNWLWKGPETVQCAHDTFRQVLRFMDEFPDFHFSQSQASIYEMVERTDPELFAEVAERVKEGRWELLGGAVDEGDTNLSCGEGIVRTMLLGQAYYRSRFGRTARVGWLPDNFGHVAQLPQIFELTGISYFYAHRCQPAQGPYWWEGPDGSRVLAFATPTYNGEVTPELRDAPRRYDPAGARSMAVYGVGDHGGGPTRRDITRAKEYEAFRSFPKMRFGTAESFYRALETNGDAYPVHRGELQYVFEGCYTTIARVKEANRAGENLLYLAEMLASLGAIRAGTDYPREMFERAWWIQAFNQFHDILCGSAIREANDEALADYHAAHAPVREWVGTALRGLWAEWGRTRTPRPVGSEGHPVMVFNPLPRERADVVEVEIFTPASPPTARIPHWGHFLPRPVDVVDVGQGPFASVTVETDEGRRIPGQVVDGKLFPNGYRTRVQFVADGIPPTGMRGFRVLPGEPAPKTPELRTGKRWIETPRYRIEFDQATGQLAKIRDRKAKRDVVSSGGRANALQVSMEAPHAMSAWDLGAVTRVERIDDVQSAEITEHGPVRAVHTVRRRWGRSEFVQRTIAYAEIDRIDFETEIRWYEVGGPDHDSPTLRVAFPLAIADGRFFCETPFAAVERPRDGQEVPAQKWVDLSKGGYGAALLSDSKYGFRCTDHVVEMTLLRAAYEPDICPDLGPHTVRYSLLPHRGTWKSGGVDHAGIGFNLPMVGAEAPTGCDIGAPKAGLAVESDHVFLAAWKRAENGRGWIVRVYEGRGKAGDVVVRFPRKLRDCRRTDLLERPLRDAAEPRVRGSVARVRIEPHEIVTLRMTFG